MEDGLLDVLAREGVGCIVFSPLAQGLLTNRYLNGIPGDSRAARPVAYLTSEDIKPDVIGKVQRLNEIARQRGQSMAQLAIAWVLRQPAVTSALVGASSPQQIEDSLAALNNTTFTAQELTEIDRILS